MFQAFISLDLMPGGKKTLRVGLTYLWVDMVSITVIHRRKDLENPASSQNLREMI